MRIFLIVLLVLLLLTVGICLSNIVASVRFWDGEFTWNVKYLGIRILPREKKKKQKEKEEEVKEEELRKPFLMDKIWTKMQNIVGKLDMAGSGIAALPGPLQALLKSITWSDIVTDIVIGGEDAADTAKQYGIVQAGVQTVIDASRHAIRVKRKDVRIGCDFTADKSQWNAACKFKVQVGPLVGALIWLGIKFVIDSRRADKTLVSDVI